MPEVPDDAAVDALLSTTFAALPRPALPPTLTAKVMQAVNADTARTLPLRIQIVEQRHKNRLLCVVRQSGWADYDTDSSSPPSKALPYIGRVRTTHVFTGKETYESTSTAD